MQFYAIGTFMSTKYKQIEYDDAYKSFVHKIGMHYCSKSNF